MTEAASPLQELEGIATSATASVAQVRSADALERWRVTFLGRKSRLSAIVKSLATLSASDRAAVGRRANALKQALATQLAARLKDGAFIALWFLLDSFEDTSSSTSLRPKTSTWATTSTRAPGSR